MRDAEAVTTCSNADGCESAHKMFQYLVLGEDVRLEKTEPSSASGTRVGVKTHRNIHDNG